MYLEKNLELLQKKNPALAEKLRAESDMNGAGVLNNEKGRKPTCRAVDSSSGNMVLVHSIIDPEEEAKEIVDLTGDMSRNYVCVVFGFGFGYHVSEILKRKVDKGFLLVIEPRLDILKLAFTHRDFSRELKNKRLQILDTGPNIENELYRYLMSNTSLLRNIKLFQLPVYEQLVENGLKKYRELFNEMVKHSFTRIGNAPGDTLIGIANTLNNLGCLAKSFDIRKLKNRFKGIPAIVVSAGPSLDKNFRLLKKAKRRALIIAAETIQQKLLQNGIKPDIVSVLERGKNVYEDFFKEKDLRENIVLCGQSVIENEIFREYPGKYITCLKKTTTFESEVSKQAGGINTFDSGQSVAHMNLSLALELGCSPVILIGQDLAYGDDGCTHAGETVYEEKSIDDDRSNELKAGNDGDFVKVRGNYAEYVTTNRIWHQFLKWFEMKIKEIDTPVINATEGGACIEGTEVCTLEEALRRYCTKEIKTSLFSLIEETPGKESEVRLKGVKKGLSEELEKFDELEEVLNKGFEETDKLIEFKNISKLKSYFNKINFTRGSIQKYSNIFAFIIQAYRIVNFQKDTEYGELGNKEDLMEWAKVQKEFFKDVLQILDLTKRIYRYGIKKCTMLLENDAMENIDIHAMVKELGEEIEKN